MLFPHIQTKRTTLRPIQSVDGTLVFELLERAGLKGLPDRADFEAIHNSGLAAQFLVEQQGGLVGISSLRQLDQAGQHVRADIFTDPDKARYGVAMETMLLTVNYAFAMWNIRKVYFWIADADAERFGSHQALIQKEGTLPDHLSSGGQLSDMHIFAIYRDQWDEYGTRLLERLVPASAATAAAAATAA